MMGLPEPHALAVLTLTVLALILFSRENVALETSSLGVIALLATGFELFPYTDPQGNILEVQTLFVGFGHEALISVCALMIAGHGLVRTGALEPVGRKLGDLWKISPGLSMLATLVVAAVLSAFVNNTPIVVLLLPLLASVAIRTGSPASRMLMPMGFATLVGGMATTIGTSTNLLVVSIAADLGAVKFGMFDFSLPVILAGGIGILYLWLIAPRMLADRTLAMEDASPRLFTARLNIPAGSFADGREVREVIEKVGGKLTVRRIVRGESTQLLPLSDATLRADDQLIVRDTPARLKEFETTLGARLYSDGSPVDEDHPLSAGNQQLAELAVYNGSVLHRRTLADVRFLERFQLVPLALHRAGREFASTDRAIEDISLRIGDVVLVQGPKDQIVAIKREGAAMVLDATVVLPHNRKAWTAMLIMTGIVGLAGLGLLPIAVSAVLGALVMIITGCLSWDDAVGALSTQVILIVAASLALGGALVATGGTAYLTDVFLYLTDGLSPRVVIAALMLLMAVLTNIVSNNAAAVVGTPIAIGIANELQLPVEPFVLAVLFGANMSYATPMAYKTNLLVMNAGGYSFADFVRIGVPLTLMMWMILAWLLPTMYGF